MNVKGPAFLARQAFIVREHGQAAWNQFIQRYGQREKFFTQNITAVHSIPAQTFLALNDAIITHFYDGNAKVYWMFGEKSAEWAFTEGQNKSLFKPGEYRRYLMSMGAIWASYYDFGVLKVTPARGYTDVSIREVPIIHPYFELVAMAYLKRGVEYLGAPQVRYEAVSGFSRGDKESLYRFWVE